MRFNIGLRIIIEVVGTTVTVIDLHVVHPRLSNNSFCQVACAIVLRNCLYTYRLINFSSVIEVVMAELFRDVPHKTSSEIV